MKIMSIIIDFCYKLYYNKQCNTYIDNFIFHGGMKHEEKRMETDSKSNASSNVIIRNGLL